MYNLFNNNPVLAVVFVALIAIVVLTAVIFIAYFVLRRAVRWGIDHSAAGQAYRKLTEYELRQKFDTGDEDKDA